MQKLWDAGYKNMIIQNTGAGAWAEYRGPSSKVIQTGQSTYDNGMVKFKKQLESDESEYLVLIDNDCFLSNINHFEQYLTDFIAGDYDFASHFISASLYTDEYKFEGCLAPVENQKIEPAKVYPWIVPDPHWENAYLIIKKSMWNKLTVSDVSHGRKYIAGLVREGAKQAVHQASYVGTHSHYGKEWFHVGNLMKYYHLVESNRIETVSSTSELDKSRLGYFAFQEDLYGDIYPNVVKKNLQRFYDHLGGRDACLEAWGRLIKNTCMENWKI
jgi:hypothetical protein